MLEQAPRCLSQNLMLGSEPKNHPTSAHCVNGTQSLARAGLSLDEVTRPENTRSNTALQCVTKVIHNGSAPLSRPGPMQGCGSSTSNITSAWVSLSTGVCPRYAVDIFEYCLDQVVLYNCQWHASFLSYLLFALVSAQTNVNSTSRLPGIGFTDLGGPSSSLERPSHGLSSYSLSAGAECSAERPHIQSE